MMLVGTYYRVVFLGCCLITLWKLI